MTKMLITSGDGYEEVTDGEDRVYLHRLTAVAEYGVEAIEGMDVHHREIWDGGSVPFLNAAEWLEPRDPYTHRLDHING